MKKIVKSIIITLFFTLTLIAGMGYSLGLSQSGVTVTNGDELRDALLAGEELIVIERTVHMRERIRIDSNLTIMGSGRITTSNIEVIRDGVLTLDGEIGISGGRVMVSGGAVFNMLGGSITSGERYGVVVNSGVFNMYGGTINNSERRGVRVERGGTFNMHGGYILQNGHGGVYISGNSTFNMHGGEISDNDITSLRIGLRDGAGVRVESSTMNMYGGYIINNNAVRGGGVSLSNGVASISGGEIRNNVADERGGGVNGESSEIFILPDGHIAENRAGNGGGIAIAGGTVTVSGGRINENTARDGGAIEAAGTSRETNVLIHGGEIIGNEAGSGGAVDLHGSYVRMMMHGGRISSNSASGRGGGVRLRSGIFEMRGGYIEDNNANFGGGIALFGTGNPGQEPKLEMWGGLIRNNSANHGGGLAASNFEAIINLHSGEISQNTAYCCYGGNCIGSNSIDGGVALGGSAIIFIGEHMYIFDNHPNNLPNIPLISIIVAVVVIINIGIFIVLRKSKKASAK